jgi:hypothetical protein
MFIFVVLGKGSESWFLFYTSSRGKLGNLPTPIDSFPVLRYELNLSISTSICLSDDPSVRLSIRPSVHPTVHPSIRPSAPLSIRPSEKIRPLARGLRVMRVKTIGHGRGGHPCGPIPYSSWLSSIKTLKLVKLLQVKKRVILVTASTMQV